MSHTREFLETHRHVGRKLLLVLAFSCGMLLIVTGLGVGRILASSLDARDALARVEQAIAEVDLTTAGEELKRAHEEIADARTGFVLLSPWRFLPWIGRRVSDLADLYEAADEHFLPTLESAIQIGARMMDVSHEAESTLERLSDLDANSRVELLTQLTVHREDLIVTSSQIGLLARDLDELSSRPLPKSIEHLLSSIRTQLASAQEQIDFAATLALILPEFGGLQTQKHFLLLFENNDELRPGGGFMGTLGELTVLNGEVVQLSTQDVYALDGPVEQKMTTIPPEPLTRYLNVPAWFVRDASWFPDGPLSAQKALELFAMEEDLLEHDPTIFDGAIVLTPDVVAALLNLLGPITVEDQTFTSENVHEALNYEVGKGYVESGLHPTQRKEIIGLLAREIVNKLMDFPLSSWSKIVSVVDGAVKEKQLFLYSSDESLQSAIEEAGWAGSLRRPEDPADALLIVDANLASLKSDPAVQRHITYRVRRNDVGRLIASVSILYEHTGTFDWKTTRYRTYTRVYVPKGSELLRSSGTLLDDRLHNPSLAPGTVDVSEEFGFTVFGAFTAVEPGEAQTLEFTYELPESFSSFVDEGVYPLMVYKQLGAQKNALTIDIDFGTPVLTAEPAEEEEEFGDSRYLLNTILDQDLSVYVRQETGD